MQRISKRGIIIDDKSCNRTAIYVLTIKNGIVHVLFARKCFGGNRAKQQPGERYKVNHTYFRTGKRVEPYGPGSGAAGTSSQYWGKWVTIGGTNSKKAKTSFEAATMEFQDETNSKKNISKQLKMIKSYKYNGTIIYIAFLRPNYARTLDTSKGTNKKLIFASHGEIAELRWVPYNNVLNNSVMKNGIASYVNSTYRMYAIDICKSIQSKV